MRHALFDDDGYKDHDDIILEWPVPPLDLYLVLWNAIFFGNALHGLHQNT